MVAIDAPLDPDGNTALHIAVKNNDEAAVLDLVLKVDANKRNNSGNTPVHEAILHDRLKILALLVKNGGDINMTGSKGLLPLQMVALSKDEHFMDAVLACGPDVNAKDIHGNTTLIHYVTEHHEKTMDILKLLEYGSDPNITNKSGWNCLHLIASDWHLSKMALTRSLIDYGIDVNAEIPNKKLTPLQLAYAEDENEDLVHIFLQNDAKLKKMRPYDDISTVKLMTLCAHCVLMGHSFDQLELYIRLLGLDDRLPFIFDECQKELELIQRVKIKDYPLTYYQYLFTSRQENYRLSIRRKFRMEISRSVQYFSIYSDFILDKLYAGIEIRKAKDLGTEFLIETLKIPYVCCVLIIGYLSLDDLMFLHKRLKISKVCEENMIPLWN